MCMHNVVSFMLNCNVGEELYRYVMAKKSEDLEASNFIKRYTLQLIKGATNLRRTMPQFLDFTFLNIRVLGGSHYHIKSPAVFTCQDRKGIK